MIKHPVISKAKLLVIVAFVTVFNCVGNAVIAQDKGFTNKDEAKNEYKDSLKQGKWIEYTDVLYRPSKKEDSTWTWFYRLSIYTAGKENGIVRYYSTRTGKLHDELPYTNGKRNGVDRKYDENGDVQEECMYTNDKMNGIDRLYSNNKLSFEMPVTDDKIEGVMKEYYPSGLISKEMSYVNDKQNGITKVYDENGRLLSESLYINGNISGVNNNYCYYEDGKLWWKSSIDYDNQKKGIETEYDENGSLLLNENIINENEEHFEWEKKDEKIINSIMKVDRNSPKKVESVFLAVNPNVFKDTLGFGWTEASMTLAAGGYTSIFSTFYYYHDSIVSYTLQPQNYFDSKKNKDHVDSCLQKKYSQWYSPCFTKFDTINYTIRNIKMQKIVLSQFRYNEAGILSPLKEYETATKNRSILLPKNLLHYMSPLSGSYYGYAGGLPPTIFPNRKEFNEIKDSLTNDEIFALLYSINPASRLTAIEYCIKKDNPIIEEQSVKKWIDKIYTEVPRISTMYGCIGTVGESKELVEAYSKVNIIQDNGFTNKEEAKNQYKGLLKEGKWIEYLNLQMNNTTKDSAIYFRLVIYNRNKEEGIVRYYKIKDGSLEEERPYAGGKIQGTLIRYYPSGKMFLEAIYNNGTKEAELTYYENGSLLSENSFSNGFINLITTYYINGNTKLILQNDTITNKAIKLQNYYPNGKIQSETIYNVNGIRSNRIQKDYYLNGRVKKETPYTNLAINGIVTTYDTNGIVTSKGRFVNGRGKERDYSNGKLIAKIHYIDGKKNGIEKGYYENGKLKYKISYVNNIVSGEAKRYDEQGKLE